MEATEAGRADAAMATAESRSFRIFRRPGAQAIVCCAPRHTRKQSRELSIYVAALRVGFVQSEGVGIPNLGGAPADVDRSSSPDRTWDAQ
jgi:hypothetical protein